MTRDDDVNAAAIASLQFRRVLALSFFVSFIALMPCGIICPCATGIAIQRRITHPVVITLGFILPLVGLAGTLLMGMDIGRYGRKLTIARKLDKLGMVYTEWPKFDQWVFARSLRLFAERSFDSATNLFEGKYHGQEVTGVDYSYTRGVGRYQAAYTQTLVLLHDAVTGVPNFVITPRGMLDRISPWLGEDRIELEGEKQFNKQFALSGGIRRNAIAGHFTAEVIEFFLEDPALSAEVFDGDLIVCHRDKAIAAGGYEPLLEQAVQLAAALRRSR